MGLNWTTPPGLHPSGYLVAAQVVQYSPRRVDAARFGTVQQILAHAKHCFENIRSLSTPKLSTSLKFKSNVGEVETTLIALGSLSSMIIWRVKGERERQVGVHENDLSVDEDSTSVLTDELR